MLFVREPLVDLMVLPQGKILTVGGDEYERVTVKKEFPLRCSVAFVEHHYIVKGAHEFKHFVLRNGHGPLSRSPGGNAGVLMDARLGAGTDGK